MSGASSRFRVAFDLGSSAVKAVLVDANGAVCWHGTRPSAGAPLRAMRQLVEALAPTLSGAGAAVAVTGRSRQLLAQQLATCTEVSEVAALCRGVAHLYPTARDVISIGGQYSLWCRLDQTVAGNWLDFALSDRCATGGGSFLEQQSARLGLSLQELSEAALRAKRAPAVASRCSVFTKSDIIHLQTKGTPVEEIALGLCRALGRGFQALVLQGRVLEVPLVFVGGCARSQGVRRAFQDVLRIEDEHFKVPEAPELVAAFGAALCAVGPTATAEQLGQAVARAENRPVSLATLEPLPRRGYDVASLEPVGGAPLGADLFLGVDVGSVSTNVALVDRSGNLVDCAYVRTQGKPLVAIGNALELVRSRYSQQLPIVAAGATGSGRHLAAKMLGATVVKNEIVAQLRAAVRQFPECDTVFEIGGQDAKYIRVEHGRLLDFAMNRICAAGTGSFLEEQAELLGIAICGEFAERALRARAPVELGRRCTVFMETEAVAAMAAGASIDDVAAGLAIGVARNYLERVVADRPVGKRIVFQGGTAANHAVVAAFRALLGSSVQVHPYHRVSGAFGIALLALDQHAARRAGEPSRTLEAPSSGSVQVAQCAIREAPSASSAREAPSVSSAREAPRTLDLIPTDVRLERSFECQHCASNCQVTRFSAHGEALHFGDACERYSIKDGLSGNLADPLERRMELILGAAGLTQPDGVTGDAIGLVRASLSMALLPWLAELARAAGRVPWLSSSTSNQTLTASMALLRSDTCLPIRAAHGHVAELASRGIKQILLPSFATLPGEEGVAHSCLFSHHLPQTLATAFADIEFIAPELSLDLPAGRRVDSLAEVATVFGLSRRQVEAALVRGDEVARRARQELLIWGEQVLDAGTNQVVVVLGRPYLLSDPLLNLSLGRHLARLGLLVLPFDALPFERFELDDSYADLPWRFARDLVRAARCVAEDARLFPVVVSSFGCGPDAFTLRHLERILAGKPSLLLELDEHRSEAGLVTRVEAFADAIAAHTTQQRRASAPNRAIQTVVKREKRPRLVVPYYADHAVGMCGILRAAGYEVELLTPPTPAIRSRGESLVSGRECHPFAMLVGDLASFCERESKPSNTAFLFPGTVVSCLLRQYGDGLNLLLTRLVGGGLRILTPSLDSWADLIGTRLTLRLQATLVATDALLQARCRIRPHELRAGETDTVYRRCLERLALAAEQGGLFSTLEQCAGDLAAIERDQRQYPVVGVAGDVYTRINDFASDGLIRTLETAGCEVWPAPFGADVAEFNATRRRQLAWRLRRPRWRVRFGLAAHLMQRQRRRIDALFAAIFGFRPEPDPEVLQALARPHLGDAANPLLVLNVGRMLLYATSGVDGIINASCINCMVGSVSQTFLNRIRDDFSGLPTTMLVYGGSDDAGNRARLDAFVHQVIQRSRTRV